ncbi:MAG: polysaccharide pyruvyl transferase family protein [Pirellulales bacterium]
MRPSTDPIPVRYFVAIPNVGDLVTPSIVSGVCRRDTVWVANGDAPHLLATGSILSWATPRSLVWGTGVIHPDMGIGAPRKEHIHALRGRLSIEVVSRELGGLPDLPLGDPAWLAAGLLGIGRATSPSFRLGVVAHYVDRQHPAIQNLLRQDGVVDLDVHRSPASFLRTMACCEAVASTSLHGLIFAESLGIPNVWVNVSGEIIGGTFKFDDWFSMCGSPQRYPVEIQEASPVAGLVAAAALHECRVDAHALTACFPREAFGASQAPPAARFLPADRCRERPLPLFLVCRDDDAAVCRAVDAVREALPHVEVSIIDCATRPGKPSAVLDALEAAGVAVFRHEPRPDRGWVEQVNDSLERFFSTWGEPRAYALAASDSLPDPLTPELVEACVSLINRFRKARCVAPGASDDHGTRAGDPPIVGIVEAGPAGPLACWETTDSTGFAVHRAGEAFALGKPCIAFRRA